MNTAMPAAHSMNMGNGCKISMLWNWNVIDSCFMSSSWHIHSKATFALSCIGIVLLAITLEFLRRAGKEYDRFILAQHDKHNNGTGDEVRDSMVHAPSSLATSEIPSSTSLSGRNAGNKNPRSMTMPTTAATCGTRRMTTMLAAKMYRPSLVQQVVRSLLHTCQFAVAFIVMLLAMYYNGYFILCIFLGVYIGNFMFGWESFKVANNGEDRTEESVTVCCG